MRKLLLFLLLSPALAFGQTTFYATVSTPDFGLGGRIDQQIGDFGLYAVTTKGNYRFHDGIYINDHWKYSVGGIRYLKSNPEATTDSFLTCGLCYHTYGEKAFPDGYIKTSIFTPVSVDVGVGIRIEDRFSSALLLDILKWDVAISFGISLWGKR